MTKLEALNALEVENFSCDGNELEYVLAQATGENIEALLGAGFTAEQILEAQGGEDDDIDLAVLAFEYADAAWWSKGTGFTAGTEEESR